MVVLCEPLPMTVPAICQVLGRIKGFSDMRGKIRHRGRCAIARYSGNPGCVNLDTA